MRFLFHKLAFPLPRLVCSLCAVTDTTTSKSNSSWRAKWISFSLEPVKHMDFDQLKSIAHLKFEIQGHKWNKLYHSSLSCFRQKFCQFFPFGHFVLIGLIIHTKLVTSFHNSDERAKREIARLNFSFKKLIFSFLLFF